MDRYIDQLISDIDAEYQREERRRVPPFETAKLSPEEETAAFEAEMREVERFVSERPQTHLFARAGLRGEQFPASDKLSEAQAARVVTALEQLWGVYNCAIILPEEMPARRQYELIVKYSAEPMFFFGGGTFTMDFCTGEPVGCELGEYCPCSKMKFDENGFPYRPEETE